MERRLLLLTCLILSLISCEKDRTEKLNGIEGQWFLSKQSSLTYSYPKGISSGVPFAFSEMATSRNDISIRFYNDMHYEFNSPFAGRLSGRFQFANDSTIFFFDSNDFVLNFFRGDNLDYFAIPEINQFPDIPLSSNSDSVIFCLNGVDLLVKAYTVTERPNAPSGEDSILIKSSLTTFKR